MLTSKASLHWVGIDDGIAICRNKKISYVMTAHHFVIYCFEARKAYKFIQLDDHSPLYSGQGWGFAKKPVSSNPRLAVAGSYHKTSAGPAGLFGTRTLPKQQCWIVLGESGHKSNILKDPSNKSDRHRSTYHILIMLNPCFLVEDGEFKLRM